MGLTVVSEPMLHHIGSYLDRLGAVHLTQTCKDFHRIFNRVEFWRTLSLRENPSLSFEDVALMQLDSENRTLIYKASTLNETNKSHTVFKKLVFSKSEEASSDILNLISREDNRKFVLAQFNDFKASKVYYEKDPIFEFWEFFQNNGEEIKELMIQAITKDKPYEVVEERLSNLVKENLVFKENAFEEMKKDTDFMCNFLPFLFPKEVYSVLDEMKKGLPEFLMHSYLQFISMASLQREKKDIKKQKEKSYGKLIFFNHLQSTQIFHLKKPLLFEKFQNIRLLSEAKILYPELKSILARIPEKKADIECLQTEQRKAILETMYPIFPLLESCLDYGSHGKEFNVDFLKELEILVFKDTDFKALEEIRQSLLICCTAIEAMIKGVVKDLNSKLPKDFNNFLESFSYPS
ncbi:MAG TPA: hypothetical protein VLE96_01700 [Chlamydiales bacterium]|nr:hypothetical protein [Chlamydiales bacterium]